MLTLARSGSAEVAQLAVYRGPGSEHCPGTEEVQAALRTLFPDQATQAILDGSGATSRVTIHIASRSDGHEAVLVVSGAGKGVRRILDQDPACSGMAEALAAAIAVLLGAPPPAQASTSATPPPVEPTERPPQPEPDWSWRPGMTALFLAGSTGKPRWGVDLGGVFAHRSGLAFGARMLRLFPLRTRREGGSVEVDTIGLLAGPCWMPYRDATADATVCADLGVGWQRAQANGYLTNGPSASRPWWVAGLFASGSAGLFRPLRLRLTVGATGRLRAQRYSVTMETGEETVYEEPRAAVWLGVGIAAEL